MKLTGITPQISGKPFKKIVNAVRKPIDYALDPTLMEKEAVEHMLKNSEPSPLAIQIAKKVGLIK